MTAILDVRPAPTPVTVETAVPARDFRLDIQGLRALAVLLVVLYHARVPGVSGGYVGVDVFFVISGFLITGHILREIAENGRLSLGAFYARRVRRLIPAALVVVLATLVVARVWGPALQVRTTAWDALWTSGYALNVHLASEGVDYQQVNGPLSPFQHFWSLAVEEQFYLVWPLVVLLTVLVARRFGRRALGAVLVVGIGGSLYLSATLTQSSAPLAYFSAQTRAWEFGVGALVALAAARLPRLPHTVRLVAAWTGLLAIVGSAFVFDDSTAFPGIAALAPVLGCALLIAGGTGAAVRGSVASLLDRRPLQLVGRVSYGWYLWHWPVLVLAPLVLGQDFSWIRNVELSVLALWFAALTYVIVERPTQRGRLAPRRWLGRGVLMSTATAGAALLVVATAPLIAGNGAFAAPLELRSDPDATLSAALTAASASRAVPGNLTPTLEKAGADVPETESGCHLGFLQIDQGPCVYGDPRGKHTVVLFGDSHAQQWQGALDAAAKDRHWKLVSWTKAACPVADTTIVNPSLKRDYTECDTWRTATVAKIRALNPDLVIVSQSDSVPGRTVSNDHWAATTVDTMQQLAAGGQRVEFLADTPYPQADVPTCVSEHLADVRACQVKRAQAYHSSALYSDRHAQVVSTLERARIPVIDPIDWICSTTSCPVIVGDTLVYRDDSHLSNTYSTELAPLLSPLLVTAAIAPRTGAARPAPTTTASGSPTP